MFKNITGVILAGGKSSRMGENKSFLKWKNEFVINIIINNMKTCFENVIIISNLKELYEYSNLIIYNDLLSGGPLAGIHSGLTHSKTDSAFVISCDVPLINKEIITCMVDHYKGEKMFIPFADGFMQHLVGIYNKSIIPNIEFKLNSPKLKLDPKQKICKMNSLFEEIGGTKFEIENFLKDNKKNYFLNLNTPEDYSKLLTYE